MPRSTRPPSERRKQQPHAELKRRLEAVEAERGESCEDHADRLGITGNELSQFKNGWYRPSEAQAVTWALADDRHPGHYIEAMPTDDLAAAGDIDAGGVKVTTVTAQIAYPLDGGHRAWYRGLTPAQRLSVQRQQAEEDALLAALDVRPAPRSSE